MCVVLHQFNDHSLCDVEWCCALQAEVTKDLAKKAELMDEVHKFRKTDTDEERKLFKW